MGVAISIDLCRRVPMPEAYWRIMKFTALLLTMLSLLAFASDTNAQDYRLSSTTVGDSEITTLSFPAPSNQGFGVWEVNPPAPSTAQCLAVTDFTNAVPADPDQVSLSYNPLTRNFYLRNSNSPGSGDDGCNILLVRSTTDAHDYIVWRRARYYEMTNLSDQAIQTGKESEATATQRTRVTSLTVTFSTQTTF